MFTMAMVGHTNIRPPISNAMLEGQTGLLSNLLKHFFLNAHGCEHLWSKNWVDPTYDRSFQADAVTLATAAGACERSAQWQQALCLLSTARQALLGSSSDTLVLLCIWLADVISSKAA